jgi:XRE family transcriptional regulator, regulator of sulfur utilization
VSEDLRSLREALGWSQQELAERCQLEQTTISALETGKVTDPRVSTLKQLSQGMKLSPSRVLRAIEEAARIAAKQKAKAHA